MRYPYLLIFLLLGSFSFGQNVNFNSQKNWSLNKKELIFAIGATQFNGDLGGGSTYGIDNSMRDIDWPSTGYNGTVGFRYRFHPMFATTSTLSYFNIKGDDALSEEYIRHTRNLHFKSGVIELQQRIECILFSVEKFAPTYGLPSVNKAKNKNQQYYIFTGLGAAYFNPKALYNDKWTALRPLMTEGQSKPYSPIALTIPAGIGVRFGLGSGFRIGLEASYVKTFTDYMDDVSTVYADPSVLGSPEAVALANPSDQSITVGNGFNWFAGGEKRGDSDDKDAYYHLNIVILKNITYKDYGKQRQKALSTSGGGRFKV